MCGIVGILSHNPVAQELYDGLMTLQHRGQDAAGITTYDGTFHTRKELGQVRDIFHTRHMKKLTGNAGIGHARYATMGSMEPEDAQPFLAPSAFGVTFAFNGNVFNAAELRKDINEKDHRLINSDCDVEVILNLFTKAISRQNVKGRLAPKHIWAGVENIQKKAKGAYSVVAYIAGHGLLAFRDPYGIRPLQMGKRMRGLTPDFIFASESISLDLLNFEFVRDIAPGEAVFIDEKTHEVHSKVIFKKEHTPCIFEYIYLARPDSVLDRISVYKSQIRMGKAIAKQIKKAKLDIDVVMPVPDSGRTAAMTISQELNLPYREGLIKNRYIGRTFIMPGQEARKKSIRYKLNPMKMEIEGKKILLVDDSIVRGNTSKKIVEVMRSSGAKKVYFVSYCPPVTNPCLYGIDIPTRKELIAGTNSQEEIRKFIGADALFYGKLEDVKKACLTGNPKIKDMCMACLDGKYKTGDVTEEVLKKNAELRTCQKIASNNEEDSAEEQMNLI